MSNMNKCFVCGGEMVSDVQHRLDGEEGENVQCRLCGAERRISAVSGNVIWIRDGRVVAAFQDEKEQWTAMAKRYGIPEEKWPERFR